MNVLSQSEIDALMRSLETGADASFQDQDPNAVKKYDFRTANRFTKEHIRTLTTVFKSFCHHLSNYLVGLMRVSCDVDILSREEMSFMEFNNSVPSPSIISVVKVMPMGGSIIFDISKDLAFSIVSRVLGSSETVQCDNRQFTEIELMIMERIVWQMLGCFDQAWSKLLPVNTRLEKSEIGMQYAQIADNGEAVLVISMSVQLGANQYVMSFCLPRQTMAPIFKTLNMQERAGAAAAKGIEIHPDDLAQFLGSADVELSACFNVTQAKADDVLRLQVGDVIQLQHRINEPLTVNLQNKPKFRATYGNYHQHYAVKIQEAIGGDKYNG